MVGLGHHPLVNGILTLQPVSLLLGQVVQVVAAWVPHVFLLFVVRVVELLQSDRAPGVVGLTLVPASAHQVRFVTTVWAVDPLVGGRDLPVALQALTMAKMKAGPGHPHTLAQPDKLVQAHRADHS